MAEGTPRRTEAFRLRQTISQLLDQSFAIEQPMQLFHSEADPGALDRAAQNFSEMLGHVDRLGDMIADARGSQRTPADARSAA
jgi:hypothetical protein